jgi:hypothetical protein
MTTLWESVSAGVVDDDAIALADAYFLTRLGASQHWASGTEKAAALTTAFNDLVGCGEFSFDVASGEDAPSAFSFALCEQALFLLANQGGVDERSALLAQGVTTAGIINESYNKIVGFKTPTDIVIAPKARGVLASYRSDSGAKTGTFPIER